MSKTRVGFTTLAVALALIGGSFVGGSFGGGGQRGLAQEPSPPRPSHVHAGDCDEPGEIVQPLTNLTVPTGPVAGNSDAVLAEAAFSSIPQTLDELLAEDHALKVHLSREQIQVYLVCGDIGGALDANGALIVGLKEQDGSGYTGIAYLQPAGDGTTSVSVMIAKVLPGGGAGDDAPSAGVEPTAAAGDGGPAVVGVALSEFSITMPTELAAGPTQFNVSNVGQAQHNFVIEGNGVAEQLAENLGPRQSGSITLDLAPGTYTVYCPVGQGAHRANGMELTLTVT
jgi:hypothetical protein